MGFAKYHEDLVSRYVNDNRDRAEVTPQKPIPKGDKHMTDLKQFQVTAPRPLPVIVLADVSGSMAADGKIEALNLALRDMVKAFGEQSRIRAEIQVGLITFGGSGARSHLPLAPAHQVTHLSSLQAEGATPLGQALGLATQLLEDRDLIPGRAYRPVLVLVSDGMPTDDWAPALEKLRASERAEKATRFAMAIGADADEKMLKSFANDKEAPLFKANNARDIHRFFQAVTMSVATKSQSPNPNQATALLIPDLPEDELDF